LNLEKCEDKRPQGASPSNQTLAALHKAAGNGDGTAVRLVLEKGAQIEETDKGGDTALHCAVDWGHAAVVQLLLEKGAHLEAKNAVGWTAIH
jgi:ankyrin repeat protein